MKMTLFIRLGECIYISISARHQETIGQYCYKNGNVLISLNIKNDKTKSIATTITSLLHKYTNNYTDKCGRLVTSKPLTTSA